MVHINYLIEKQNTQKKNKAKNTEQNSKKQKEEHYNAYRVHELTGIK